MRALAFLIVIAVTLAGCASEAPIAEDAALQNMTSPFSEDYGFANGTVPKETLQNATLGEEHIHDLWDGAEQLILLDTTLTASPCGTPFETTAQLVASTSAGCAMIHLPDGAVVPEGTDIVRIEVDATDALKAGSMRLSFHDKARAESLEATSDNVYMWFIELTPVDWDVPHAEATTLVMSLTGEDAAVLDGNVVVRVIAEKIAGWKPILAIAHVDHWKLPELHDVPSPGVMRILDGIGNVTNIDADRFFGRDLPVDVPLTDIIAPGTKRLTIIADLISTDCPPAIDCWLIPALRIGGYQQFRIGELVHHEGKRWVYAFDVPDDVPEDSVYANASVVSITNRINACVGSYEGPTCGLVSIASGSASARLIALAWNDHEDIDTLTGIVGPAPQ